MNVIPFSSHFLANTAFSAKNPYPGCISSTFYLLSKAIIPTITRYATIGPFPTPIN